MQKPKLWEIIFGATSIIICAVFFFLVAKYLLLGGLIKCVL